ncbi:MAG: DinB family protein [Planctomycetaceae bacterium]
MPTQSEIAAEIRALVSQFEPMMRELKDEDIRERPRPKKWARKEVLGHLVDSACNNQQKFVRMMQQPHLDFPGYAQDDWVDLQKWASADWNTMVTLWAAYNQHIAYIIENVEPQCLANTITIEGAGPFTLEFIMPDYVEHMKHHLRQIFPDVDLENAFVNVYGA